MGAGDGSVAELRRDRRQAGHLPVHARAAPARRPACNAGATFISNIGGVRNYTGNLEDVFTCIAALGETGCGFEHQFASILRALGADGRGAPPAENAGFLRPDAYLAIVLITNEDDCSARARPNGRIPLFDTGSNTNMASQLGPPANFRCNEFGHLLRQAAAHAAPDRNAPNNDVTADGHLHQLHVERHRGLPARRRRHRQPDQGLKTDPSQILVAAITGPATPYTVHWKAPSTADTSCGAAPRPARGR